MKENIKRNKEIVRLHDEKGVTLKEIAKKFGISYWRVLNLYHREKDHMDDPIKSNELYLMLLKECGDYSHVAMGIFKMIQKHICHRCLVEGVNKCSECMMPNKYYILTLGLDEIRAMKGMSEKRYKVILAVREKIYKEVLEERIKIKDKYRKIFSETM